MFYERVSDFFEAEGDFEENLTSWYVNEDGVPYESTMTVEQQTATYPNDDHIPYATREDAEVGAILYMLRPNPWRQ